MGDEHFVGEGESVAGTDLDTVLLLVFVKGRVVAIGEVVRVVVSLRVRVGVGVGEAVSVLG